MQGSTVVISNASPSDVQVDKRGVLEPSSTGLPFRDAQVQLYAVLLSAFNARNWDKVARKLFKEANGVAMPTYDKMRKAVRQAYKVQSFIEVDLTEHVPGLRKEDLVPGSVSLRSEQ